MRRLSLFIYHFIWTVLAFPILPIATLFKDRHLRERLGLGLPKGSPSQQSIWIHALSIGEVVSALPLVKSLKERYPANRIVFTVATRQGMKIAHTELSGQVHQIITMPLDFWWLNRRIIAHANPKIFILVETDVWPGIIHQLKRRGIRSILINGRISPRTFRSYKRFRLAARFMLNGLETCLMQSDLDRARLIEIGIKPGRVQTIGNIKFDRDWELMADAERARWFRSLGILMNRIPWVVGSTHEGEEVYILDAFKGLHQKFPDLFLILAPRNIERVEEIRNFAAARGLTVNLRSDPRERANNCDVLILNTIGELGRVYGIGEISFVGGSLVPIGGHNLLEPASFGQPVLFGPHTHNFVLMSQLLLEAGGGLRITDVQDLIKTMTDLLSDPKKRHQMGRRAMRFVEMNRGALNRVLANIDQYMGKA